MRPGQCHGKTNPARRFILCATVHRHTNHFSNHLSPYWLALKTTSEEALWATTTDESHENQIEFKYPFLNSKARKPDCLQAKL